MLKSKKIPLLTLGVTALVCSRAFFSLINDPEGPNLLIVVVLAAIIYGLSFAVYSRNTSTTGKKLFLAIGTQIIIVAILHFFLK